MAALPVLGKFLWASELEHPRTCSWTITQLDFSLFFWAPVADRGSGLMHLQPLPRVPTNLGSVLKEGTDLEKFYVC